jgi:hypothetical protein
MLGILVLIAVALALAWFLALPRYFLEGFATLIENPRTRHSLASFPRYKSSVMGQFKGRTVGLTLVQPGRKRRGEVVLSISTDAPEGSPWKDSSLTAPSADVSRATFDLEGKYELILTLTQGSLRATSNPVGLRFPGPFDEGRWRNTLAQMHVLAEWLEKRGT